MIKKFENSKVWKKVLDLRFGISEIFSGTNDETLINFLYCIDYPVEKTIAEKTDKIEGWLICSLPIKNIRILNRKNKNYTLNYKISRPDVAQSFKDFTGNAHSGFTISAGNELIDMNDSAERI